MKLLEQQQLFARLLPELLRAAFEMGFDVTLGEMWRTPEQAQLNAKKGIGISSSLHIKRLAVDLNLFKGDKLLTDSLDYAPLGAVWKALHPLARHGGDFKDSAGRPKPDGCHFSLERDGVK